MKPDIYLYLTGGLGNQLFQLAAAMSRSIDCVAVEKTLGSPRKNSDGEPDLFDFTFFTKIVPIEKPNQLMGMWFNQKVAGYVLRQGMSPKNFEKSKLFTSGLRLISSSIFSLFFGIPIKVVQAQDNGHCQLPPKTRREFMIGYFQSYKWGEIPSVFKSLRSMKLKDPSRKLQEFLNSLVGRKTLMVHVRLGDYKNENGFGIPEDKYYADSLALHFSRVDYDLIALFSNEPDEALKFIPHKYQERVVIAPEFDGRAAETLEAMRHMNGYVLANSSLSWWGAFLSYQESPLVVTPKPWFKENAEPTEIIPPAWMRIDAWSDLNTP